MLLLCCRIVLLIHERSGSDGFTTGTGIIIIGEIIKAGWDLDVNISRTVVLYGTINKFSFI